MRNVAIILLACATASTCLAQDKDQSGTTAQTAVPNSPKPEESFYRLQFVIKEYDGGKVVNSRTYSMIAATGSQERYNIRTSAKVRVSDHEWQNVDVGTSIDCWRLRQLQGQLAMNVTANIRGLPEESAASTSTAAVERQYIWSSEVLIPIKKPTVVFWSDSNTSKNQMQVELTATPVL